MQVIACSYTPLCLDIFFHLIFQRIFHINTIQFHINTIKNIPSIQDVLQSFKYFIDIEEYAHVKCVTNFHKLSIFM